MDNENFTDPSPINLTLDTPGSGENADPSRTDEAPQQPAGAVFTQPMTAPTIPQQPAGAAFTQPMAAPTMPQQPAGVVFTQPMAAPTIPQQPAGAVFTQPMAAPTMPQQPAGAVFTQPMAAPVMQPYMTPASPVAEISNMPDASVLSDSEKMQVAEFTPKINLHDSSIILQYGLSSQKNISTFSEATLDKVRTKDMGEVGNMLTGLTVELKGFTAMPDEKKGIFGGIFKKGATQIEYLKTKYTRVEVNVNNISEMLENHRIQLLKDIAMFDEMYKLNFNYYKEITMYILAGKERLAVAQQTELPALKQKAQQSQSPQDAQIANDFEELCNRFEKRIYDLELTRNISIQMAPQIRLLQNGDTVLVDKIQSSIVNTIPLWKSQMVIALGLANSQKALQAQKAVTDLTNDLLKKNADLLKTGSSEIAKESERGIVDIDTLKYTNDQLIASLEEVARVHAEGKQNRLTAESELVSIENTLKQKLIGG